jgi:hypothetical protein
MDEIMASVFWDKEGILFVDFLEKGYHSHFKAVQENKTKCDNASVEFVLIETRKTSFAFTTMPGLTSACAKIPILQ